MPKKRSKKFVTPYPLVWVEWIDSCEPADNSEVEDCDIPEPQTMYQVGHLVKVTEEYVSIAGCYKPGLGTYDYVITIPQSAIKKIKRLTGKV